MSDVSELARPNRVSVRRSGEAEVVMPEFARRAGAGLTTAQRNIPSGRALLAVAKGVSWNDCRAQVLRDVPARPWPRSSPRWSAGGQFDDRFPPRATTAFH